MYKPNKALKIPHNTRSSYMQKDDVMVKFYTKPKTIFEKLLFPMSNKEKLLERMITR